MSRLGFIPSTNTSTKGANDAECCIQAHVHSHLIVGMPLVLLGPPFEPDGCCDVSNMIQKKDGINVLENSVKNIQKVTERTFPSSRYHPELAK